MNNDTIGIQPMLPLKGANGSGVLFTQAVGQSLSKAVGQSLSKAEAIGLDYIGLSARKT